MRCADFLSTYDALEPEAELPWLLRRHLDSCQSCRVQVERLETAIKTWKVEEGASMGQDSRSQRLEDRVMAAVRLTPRPRRVIGIEQWAVSGMLLAFSGVLIPFASGFAGFRGVFGNDVLFPLALVLGTLLAIFGFLFIGSHFDELRGMLDRRESDKSGLIHRH